VTIGRLGISPLIRPETFAGMFLGSYDHSALLAWALIIRSWPGFGWPA